MVQLIGPISLKCVFDSRPLNHFVSPTDGTDTITDSNRPPAQGKFDGKALAGGDSPDGKETLLFG